MNSSEFVQKICIFLVAFLFHPCQNQAFYFRRPYQIQRISPYQFKRIRPVQFQRFRQPLFFYQQQLPIAPIANLQKTLRCLDGTQPAGACFRFLQCGTGYTCCTTGLICCANTNQTQLNNVCPAGEKAIGETINGECPTGFTPNNGKCCGRI